MFRYNLGPNFPHIPNNFVENMLISIMSDNKISSEKRLSEKTQGLFVNKINFIIDYVKSSKYYQKQRITSDNITPNMVVDRCDILVQRANEGIMPLIAKYEKLNLEYIENKTVFKTTRAKLKNDDYKQKILNLPISGCDTIEARERFLHLEDNEYADFLAGRVLYHLFLALYCILKNESPEKIFEFTDTARRVYDEFLVQYEGLKNSKLSSDAKKEEQERVSQIFKDFADNFNDQKQEYKIIWDYENNRLKRNSEIVELIKEKYEEKYHKKIERSNKWIEERINRAYLHL